MADLLKNYTKALDLLKKAEAAHKEALDAIDAARDAGKSDRLPRLRMQAQSSERHLGEVWEEAARAHRGFWLARKIKLIPELHRLALVAREYDAIAKAAGDMTVMPWKAVFDGEYVRSFDPQTLVQEVPLEPPECELFNDEFGAWRWGTP
ncbi:hypothetical protein [Hydrogenophaga sp.]|uniref:hypothetical protein n=1 Tax=Hydrogenophaga sp. TaxID=1904254 RepID=UPI00273453DB|nr:hypothetical protein [Hydrogenophaga sp.]MDP3106957.1 hypothetical protein [Hydrogenophaga sp.]